MKIEEKHIKGGQIVYDCVGIKYIVGINTKNRYVLVNYNTGQFARKSYTKNKFLVYLQEEEFVTF